MTIEEFKKQKWTAEMYCTYSNPRTKEQTMHAVATVCFSECLVGLCDPNVDECEPEDIHWVRCENVTLGVTGRGRT
ncbi:MULTISPECIES: hypothetical protein [Cysteiniphilum]|uniref:Uncharacterized protein n=1 Tax=Cysteiniphilum litorale TaxID=2056700 RepID=A0A8J3E8Z9_9GAMM|nr:MULTISPECIES: hypothetical protein [Cysteiniphilum]GGG03187.1 hypothetical protein GCM10010995_20800 [Cysteiniphilum litorale]